MTEWTTEKQKEVVKSVLERSKRDPEFRDELLTHPHLAIQEATGEVVPDKVRLQFVDASVAHLTVVLPPVTGEADELSEQQLEAVAGGKGGIGGEIGGVALSTLAEAAISVGFAAATGG